ncbi:MAG: acyl-CoA thioesterase [Synechocystis sp.]|jgi:enediyne biosynthesis thioesterase
MRNYEYKHIVGFEETNLVGNVYYANYILWQGRCREMFLYDHAPDIIQQLSQGLALVTVRVSCDYFSELYAFDQVIIRMSLKELRQNRITMLFDYWKILGAGEELVAKGEQQAACMQRQSNQTVATAIPPTLKEALEIYRVDS